MKDWSVSSRAIVISPIESCSGVIADWKSLIDDANDSISSVMSFKAISMIQS